ncbi:c-type cytochrome [Futiania mangrovi]|uniref:Cytochrome c n=1 Tax=Futiania mangrovi TaxID=2959716 RepID=A0A9J6PK43_9PROT|nr:c-type cytochrome [Futiania mangrovii]MCP1336919.1 cytochrome c [Futiania mangrovii]
MYRQKMWTGWGGKACTKAVAALLAAAVTLGTASAASVDEGREIAEARCSMCHAVGQSGPSPHPEAPPFRILQDRYDVRLLEEALAEGMITGHPDMPVVELDVDQVESFLLYLESLGQ